MAISKNLLYDSQVLRLCFEHRSAGFLTTPCHLKVYRRYESHLYTLSLRFSWGIIGVQERNYIKWLWQCICDSKYGPIELLKADEICMKCWWNEDTASISLLLCSFSSSPILIFHSFPSSMYFFYSTLPLILSTSHFTLCTLLTPFFPLLSFLKEQSKLCFGKNFNFQGIGKMKLSPLLSFPWASVL